MKSKGVAVIGAGSWGTAIARVLSTKCNSVQLWGHRKDHIRCLLNDRENKKYLPGFPFAENIEPTTDLIKAVKDCSVICMVVPSQQFREVFKNVLCHINTDCTVVSAVKGIENSTLYSMVQVMEEEIFKKKINLNIEVAVLSGPSFAKEVADETPTAVTIGCASKRTCKNLQNLFVTEYFRVYASQDIIGLEISAAFKNIIAIATGICDGLGYGLNTRAAIITRGLAEITRIGIKLGADPLTFSGLSGMGDLILTCTGDLSRNRYVGLQLGKGKKLEEILKEMNMVAEGVKTTQSAYKLAKKNNIEMPILEQVYSILYKNKSCKKAVKDLLKRELKSEQ